MPLAAFADAPSGPILAAIPTATASPAPKPAAKADPLTISGYLRAFDFDRLNQTQNAANPNRQAYNFGGLIKGEYRLFDTPFSVGAGYYGDFPFGANGLKPQFNSKIDNTLPGYSLSTLGQLYVKYNGKGIKGQAGDILLNSSWFPASDSRMKPALYQGGDVSASITNQLSVGATRVTGFENRNQSAFERQTLLSTKLTSGAVGGNIGYKMPNDFVTLQYNSFYDYANLAYVEAGGNVLPNSEYKPTLAVQYVNEQQTGKALVGKIQNNTYGVKVGAALSKNLGATFAFDDAPYRYAIVAATSSANAGKPFFLPGGGTPTVMSLGGGRYKVAYGGIASPYSDSYATDPIYTTSITQGTVDRRSAGPSFKGAFTYTSNNKRFIGILSEAYYEYGNDLGLNNTNETNVDVTYRLSPVKATGTYHGLSIRERFADRVQDTLPFDFKYIRTQLQYDF